MSHPLRQKLSAAHAALLDVHKALLDHEKPRYELVHGKINTPNEFLHLLLNDPFFSYLRKLSGLITQYDILLSSKDPFDPARAKTLLDETRALVTPAEAGNDFQQNYFAAIQASPDIALMHAGWKKTIAGLVNGQ
jgi:hypothetical protein